MPWDPDCIVHHFRRHVWVCVLSIIALPITFLVTVVFAQEPHATVGLPAAVGPTLIEQWASPTAVCMIGTVVALIVTLRENVKVIKEQIAELKAQVAAVAKAINDNCVSQREFDEYKQRRGGHSS